MIHYLHSASFPLWFVIFWCPFTGQDFEDMCDPFSQYSALCQVCQEWLKSPKITWAVWTSQFPVYPTMPRKTPWDTSQLKTAWNLSKSRTFGNVPLQTSHAWVFLCSSEEKAQIIFDFTELNSWYILRMMMECLISQRHSSQSLKQQLQHEKVVVLKEKTF